ncbi:MAG: hypothetical protein DMD60_05680 [Gemmatimonadetes bacterium]|nr:MAG: hypothetical protein DMD60_05680 [Gemmatimonadota bacterium]
MLVVTDVAARLVRRGLLAPDAAARGGWRGARVLVFRRGPVVCERPPGAWTLDVALHPARTARALTLLRGAPTFQPHR